MYNKSNDTLRKISVCSKACFRQSLRSLEDLEMEEFTESPESCEFREFRPDDIMKSLSFLDFKLFIINTSFYTQHSIYESYNIAMNLKVYYLNFNYVANSRSMLIHVA